MNVFSMCKYVIYTLSSIASLLDLYRIRAYSSIIIWNFKFWAFCSSSMTFQLDTKFDRTSTSSTLLAQSRSFFGHNFDHQILERMSDILSWNMAGKDLKTIELKDYDLIWFSKLNNCHGPSFQHFSQDRWAALFSWPCRDGPWVASKWWSQVMWHRLHLLWIRGALDWSWMESWKSSGKYRWCSIMFLFPKRIMRALSKQSWLDHSELKGRILLQPNVPERALCRMILIHLFELIIQDV